MWKTFVYNNDLYLLKSRLDDTSFLIYITNLKEIWHQTFNRNSLVELFKLQNPLIECDESIAMHEVQTLLDNVTDDTTISMEIHENNNLELFLQSDMHAIQLKFKFQLCKGDTEMFCNHVIIPLIRTIKSLEDYKNTLVNIIRKKDREIEEYRLEKGNISRGDLMTERFDINHVVMSEHVMLNTFKDSSEFWSTLVSKFGDYSVDLPSVTVTPWNEIQAKSTVYSKRDCKKIGTGVVFK